MHCDCFHRAVADLKIFTVLPVIRKSLPTPELENQSQGKGVLK